MQDPITETWNTGWEFKDGKMQDPITGDCSTFPFMGIWNGNQPVPIQIPINGNVIFFPVVEEEGKKNSEL